MLAEEHRALLEYVTLRAIRRNAKIKKSVLNEFLHPGGKKMFSSSQGTSSGQDEHFIIAR